MAITAALRWVVVAATCMAAPTSLAIARTAAPFAQDAKAELDKKLADIGGENCKDAAKLFEVAKWADDNNLKTESKRLLRQVIKIDPDHAEARALLGYQKFEGKWLTQREVDREKSKKEETDKAAKGLKKWKGEWVPKEDYEKYEKGLVPVDVKGEKKWVTPAEKERIEKGLVLYKGLWVSPEDKEHLDKNEFKGAGGKWVSKEEADKFHSEFTNPWEFEGQFVHLVTTCSYDFTQTALSHADKTVQQTYNMLGIEMPKDLVKVEVILVKDRTDYNQLGSQLQGDEAAMSSNYSTFVFKDPNTDRNVGVTIYEQLDGAKEQENNNYSLMHVRHAASAAAIRNMSLGETPPAWFTVGVATYCERYWHPTDARGIRQYGAWSIDMLNQQGGLLTLKNFFDKFTVTKQTILQSGFLVSYLVNAPRDKKSKIEENWQSVLEGFKAPKQKGLEKKFVKLEIQLSKDGEKELAAYENQLRGK